jgi:hypothetical protein
MPLGDVLQKEDVLDNPGGQPPTRYYEQGFRFIRTDTHTQDVIDPPTVDNNRYEETPSSPKRRSFFRRHSGVSPGREKGERRISHLLHIDRSRSRSNSSTSLNIPSDLPQIENENGDAEEREAQWEKRATRLIQGNPQLSSPSQPLSSEGEYWSGSPEQQRSRSRSNSRVNDPEGDVST